MNAKGFLRRTAAFCVALMIAVLPALGYAQEGTDDIDIAVVDPDAASADPSGDDQPADEEAAQAEEDDDSIKYVALTTTMLKLRRTPEKINNAAGSIEKGETVYIVELGAEWAKIRTSRMDGWVQTDYLSNIREYDPQTAQTGLSVEPPQFDTAATEDNNGFKNNYYAHTVRASAIYEQPSTDSRRKASVAIYRKLIVSESSGGWSYVKLNNTYGYMLTDHLFKWDRINAYAGEIPGLIIYPLLGFTNKSTNIYSAKTNKILRTINPGSGVALRGTDELGRYSLVHWREDAYISPEDIELTYATVPYDQAQPGDLISVMTTFYAVGVSTLNYRGRNWNIYLSSSLITGTVLEPGDTFDMNKKIGPYSKSTGYHLAPIMSKTKTQGYGGGTCQVNTTFYITSIQVPILINHRKVHAEVGMKYCLKGFDAAVGDGDINLQLTNTLPYAIRYQFFISDGVLTCCIYRDH